MSLCSSILETTQMLQMTLLFVMLRHFVLANFHGFVQVSCEKRFGVPTFAAPQLVQFSVARQKCLVLTAWMGPRTRLLSALLLRSNLESAAEPQRLAVPVRLRLAQQLLELFCDLNSVKQRSAQLLRAPV